MFSSNNKNYISNKILKFIFEISFNHIYNTYVKFLYTIIFENLMNNATSHLTSLLCKSLASRYMISKKSYKLDHKLMIKLISYYHYGVIIYAFTHLKK